MDCGIIFLNACISVHWMTNKWHAAPFIYLCSYLPLYLSVDLNWWLFLEILARRWTLQKSPLALIHAPHPCTLVLTLTPFFFLVYSTNTRISSYLIGASSHINSIYLPYISTLCCIWLPPPQEVQSCNGLQKRIAHSSPWLQKLKSSSWDWALPSKILFCGFKATEGKDKRCHGFKNLHQKVPIQKTALT